MADQSQKGNNKVDITSGDVLSSDVVGGNIVSGSIVVGNSNVAFDKITNIVNYYRPPSDEEKEKDATERQLLEQIDRYFDIVAETLYENPLLQAESLKRLQDAKEILCKTEGNDFAWTLNRAQFETRRVHVVISKEQQLQRGEAQLRWIVPALVLL